MERKNITTRELIESICQVTLCCGGILSSVTPYSQGIKANVIFLQKGRPTEKVWIFDARSNVPGITKKERPLRRAVSAQAVRRG